MLQADIQNRSGMCQCSTGYIIHTEILHQLNVFFCDITGAFRFCTSVNQLYSLLHLAGVILSSMIISAPASTASFTMSRFSVSTSILRTNGACFLRPQLPALHRLPHRYDYPSTAPRRINYSDDFFRLRQEQHISQTPACTVLFF